MYKCITYFVALRLPQDHCYDLSKSPKELKEENELIKCLREWPCQFICLMIITELLTEVIFGDILSDCYIRVIHF